MTKKTLENKHPFTEYSSTKRVYGRTYFLTLNRILGFFALGIFIVLFLPWTQNISGKGKIVTRNPGQRPQTIQSLLPGRIDQWFVREGDYVAKGDTLLRLSENKSDYFDDQLVERTQAQVNGKTEALKVYQDKIAVLTNRISVLEGEQVVKLNQLKNKQLQLIATTNTDSINVAVSSVSLKAKLTQYNRAKSLFKEGLKSSKEIENSLIKYQEAQGKNRSYENKWLSSQAKLSNIGLEFGRLKLSFQEKINKAKSDLYTTQNDLISAQNDLFKMKSTLANYQKRQDNRYVTAEQDGMINRIYKKGIGENVKTGEKLMHFMPRDYELAVETYVRPIDLPLIHKGETVRVQFDGWPAIVFSGWPNVSYGTYGAKVVAIENYISENGMFRILLSPDETDGHIWPNALKVGSGVKTMALLDDVTIGFELWRQLNSFPPNFYQPNTMEKTTSYDKK
ncbi:MAG: HlyD family secretion protein [Flavobacteriales bacterium]